MRTRIRPISECHRLLALSFCLFCSLVQSLPSQAIENTGQVTCTASSFVIAPGSQVTLQVFAVMPADRRRPVSYRWTATGGTIEDSYPTAQWSFGMVPPGQYSATFHMQGQDTAATQCTVNIFVDDCIPPKVFTRSEGSRETGSDLLSSHMKEMAGYGLYTYLLLSSPPGEQTITKYEYFVRTFLRMVPEINALERHIPPSQLNVAYLPVTSFPPQQLPKNELVTYILANYDYARSRSILRLLPGDHRNGPYIVSFPSPITGHQATVKPFLVFDLTIFPPEMIDSAIKEYLCQAENEAFYEERSLPRLALNISNTVHVLAAAQEPIVTALHDWLKLFE